MGYRFLELNEDGHSKFARVLISVKLEFKQNGRILIHSPLPESSGVILSYSPHAGSYSIEL